MIYPLHPRPLFSLFPLLLVSLACTLPLPPPWDSKGCYLTRSMTLSRGASLTVSSLMAKIWSPGRSLPKEGPSADEMGHTSNMQCHMHVIKSYNLSHHRINLICHHFLYSLYSRMHERMHARTPTPTYTHTNQQRRIVQ